MTLDQRLANAVHRVADGVTVPEVDLDAVRFRAHRNRRRTISVAASAAVVAVIVAGTVVVGGRYTSAPEPVHPVQSPQIAGSGPVWYDAAGLHHGAVVEQTAVELVAAPGPDGVQGVLALVRGGAVYRNDATDDVWFHPWGGEPRVVGHGSATGPGGDPKGDIAAWFEGSELVVYDTARDREISRTTQDPVLDFATWEQGGGNGFRHVSADEVVWASVDHLNRLDLATGTSSILWEVPALPTNGSEDVHDGVRVTHDFETSALIVTVDGGQDRRIPALGPSVELSSDGLFLLAPGDSDANNAINAAAIVDVRSGERWNLPGGDHGYPAIAWSYGDVAIVLVDRGTGKAPPLACHALTRKCEELPFQGPVLLPTS